MNDKIREKLKKLIEEIMMLDIDKVDNDRDLATIDEWDSFNNLMLISRVEDEFGIKFSIKDIEDVNTINKIIEVTKKKAEEKDNET